MATHIATSDKENARETSVRLQPNSSMIGLANTPKVKPIEEM